MQQKSISPDNRKMLAVHVYAALERLNAARKHLPIPRRFDGVVRIGRSPGLRVKHHSSSFPFLNETVDCVEWLIALQWRDRVGFAPTSLLCWSIQHLFPRYIIVASSLILVKLLLFVYSLKSVACNLSYVYTWALLSLQNSLLAFNEFKFKI